MVFNSVKIDAVPGSLKIKPCIETSGTTSGSSESSLGFLGTTSGSLESSSGSSESSSGLLGTSPKPSRTSSELSGISPESLGTTPGTFGTSGLIVFPEVSVFEGYCLN